MSKANYGSRRSAFIWSKSQSLLPHRAESQSSETPPPRLSLQGRTLARTRGNFVRVTGHPSTGPSPLIPRLTPWVQLE